MGKIPFEKVRSLVERRKLFEGLLREQNTIVCKGADESLFQIKPMSIVGNSHMIGLITAIEKAPTNDTEVIGNFSVGVDRYFFQTPMQIQGDEALIQLSADIYLLQRRASLRLGIQPEYGIFLSIIEFQGKPVYSIAQIADLSAGGVKFFFSNVDSPVPAHMNSKKLDFRVGDRFKGVVHFTNAKKIEITGEVKHIQQAVHRGEIVEHIGVEFVELTGWMKNRLMSLTMDLQRRIVTGVI